jgi:FtsP/CotA-like multicopper oxidase with cupredoxin domain
MLSSSHIGRLLVALLLVLGAANASAQSFRVQCPAGTKLHPATVPTGYSTFTQWGRTDGLLNPTPTMANPNIKCQQIAGGDGFVTMGDGVQTYLFGFGPLSGLADIVSGLPGTQPASVFNVDSSSSVLNIGDPTPSGYTFNGAVGLVPDPESDPPGLLTGHVDPRSIMDVGVMNASEPAPLMAIDEDDEFFLTLTNVGQIMRPDLFEQHTVHFHGYPNASAFYDGVPDASIAINIGGSFTYYYLAPEAGTYFWHCHISPPEHLQMGMVGQIYVRPRQNRVTGDLGVALKAANMTYGPSATGMACNDILCSNQTPLPAGANATTGATGVNGGGMYAYNDGNGSTRYDVEYPIQMMGFDSNFHFVGMTFNPESFTDMKDKYHMLNGRSYPDTISPGPMQTQSTDGTLHSSQVLPTIINIPAGGRALLRISDLSVTEFTTLASLGIPMKVIALNARLLRDTAGNDMSYTTNSITLGGGESLDVILDATGYSAGQKFYLYTPNLNYLSNGAENFGGMMTEVNICTSVAPTTKACS